MSIVDAQDMLLLKQCIAAGILQQNDIAKVLNAHKNRYEKLQNHEVERLHQISGQGSLVTEAGRKRVAISPLLYRARDWETWGTGNLLLDNTGKEVHAIEPTPESAPVKTLMQWISTNPHQRFLYDAEFNNSLWQGPCRYFLFDEVHTSSQGPTDIYFPESAQNIDEPIVFLCNRGSGDVHVYNLAQEKIVHTLKVREKNSALSMGMAFDGTCLYVTGQDSGDVIAYNIETQQSENLSLGAGILGNITWCKNNQLLIQVRKPRPELLILDLNTDELVAQAPLPGEWYSKESNAPLDAMALSADENTLALLNFVNSPEPLSPQVIVLDLIHEPGKIKATHPVTLTKRPKSIVFASPNPAKQMTQGKIWAWLIEENLLTQAQYDDLKARMQSAEKPPAETISKSASGTKAQARQARIKLPEGSTLFVQQALHTAFEIQNGRVLEHPSALQRLEILAKQIIEQLESNPDQNLVDKTHADFDHGDSLRVYIDRQDIYLETEKQTFLETHQPLPVPTQCPLCEHRLMGLWDCPVCGYEVENVLRQFQRHVESLQESNSLEAGHLYLPDPQQSRVLHLDARKEPLNILENEQLQCDLPLHILPLPSGHFLLTDTVAGQIHKMTVQGKTLWSFATFHSVEHKLKQPAMTTAYRHPKTQDWHYLIADTGNNRVIEVNESHEILSVFKDLERPVDVHYTPQRRFLITDNAQVSEYNSPTQIARVFSKKSYDWVSPRFARRLGNGNTLVVDSGAFQIVTLSPAGDVLDRLVYYRNNLPESMRMSQPNYFARLATGDIVLANNKRAVQILYGQKKLTWNADFQDIHLRTTSPSVIPTKEPQAAPLKVAKPSAPVSSYKLPTQGFQVPRKKVAEDRLQALRNKPISSAYQESYSPSVVYTRTDTRLEKRHLYLLDQKHNSIIKLNRKGKITWHYGFDMGEKLAKPARIVVQRHSLLVTDTYNNRILEIGRADKSILMTLTGPDNSRLSHPRSVNKHPDGHYLIADQRNKRLVIINAHNALLHEIKDTKLMQAPHYAEYLPNDNILLTDAYLNHVIEITPKGQVQWLYNKGLFAPAFATRLTDGNTLITDTHHHRVIEVSPAGEIVWEYVGHAKSNRINPTHAIRLGNGNTLITYFNHSKLVEVTRQGSAVWSYTLGKDLFQPPVLGDEEIRVRQESKTLKPFYNPIEKRQLQQSIERQKPVIEVHIQCLDHVQMKSVRAQLILLRLEKFGTVFKTFPPPEDLMADHWGRDLIMTCLLAQNADKEALTHTLENIAEVAKVSVKPYRP